MIKIFKKRVKKKLLKDQKFKSFNIDNAGYIKLLDSIDNSPKPNQKLINLMRDGEK